MKKIKYLLFLLLFLIIPNVKANDEYYISSYNIDMIVNENNTFDITETITAYFNIDKHGIYRTLPYKNTVIRNDGTTDKNRAQITNVDVDEIFTKYSENGNLKIKIGDENYTFTGEKTYTIKYTYNIGKDPLNDIDELYYNIIGTEWDTLISGITFKITLPKEFDKSKLSFTHGVFGSTDTSNIDYTVNGNTITGSLNDTLDASEGLTVRLELPEGYFVNAGLVFNIKDYILYFIPVVFFIISIILVILYGKKDIVVDTVEFYPPEGYNSLDIGFLYKGNADNKDVVSLLIYLANKGYIKISEFESKALFSKKKTFKITKLKDYLDDNENEKIFLDGLFNKAYTYRAFSQDDKLNTNEVTEYDLRDNFYITLNKILRNVNNKENKYGIYEKKSINKTKYVILMIILSFILITIPSILTYGELEMLIFAVLFPGIGLLILLKGLSGSEPISSRIFLIFFGLFFGGIPWTLMVFPSLIIDPIHLYLYILGIVCIIFMSICYKKLFKRNEFGNQILGKIKGFKDFLITAEKDKLEALVEKDPEYFFNILPYTYVLGVSDKWIKKFETIALEPPTWYDCNGPFDVIAFNSFMNNTMTQAQSAMSSSPSSDSGGGSSGGGSGGGGGGSW